MSTATEPLIAPPTVPDSELAALLLDWSAIYVAHRAEPLRAPP